MAYIVQLDGVALPVTPAKLEMKMKNQNKTISLINGIEANILKPPGLTEISFSAMIPLVKYPFAIYPEGFKDANYYLEKIKQLKVDKKPFQFTCSRELPSGKVLFDTDMKVSLEDYKIDEDASEGQALMLTIQLKKYNDYKAASISINEDPKIWEIPVAIVETSRSAESAPAVRTYTVKAGDTLWNIAKKILGKGSRYMEIFNLNKDKIKNPNMIIAGQVLTMPSQEV